MKSHRHVIFRWRRRRRIPSSLTNARLVCACPRGVTSHLVYHMSICFTRRDVSCCATSRHISSCSDVTSPLVSSPNHNHTPCAYRNTKPIIRFQNEQMHMECEVTASDITCAHFHTVTFHASYRYKGGGVRRCGVTSRVTRGVTCSLDL